MKATILIDNVAHNAYKKEWGLSFYIEHSNKKILLDAGASNLFMYNAKALQIPLEDIDYGVLSHAHFDHSDGIETFFMQNACAKFYLRKQAQENCFFRLWLYKKYIGIQKGLIAKYPQRFEFIQDDYLLCEKAYLIGHKSLGLEAIGKRNHMYVNKDGKWHADDFAHEQSLVIETSKGLVIFNSCSHGGGYNIIEEVSKTFPHQKVYALVGGLHLYRAKEADVIELGKKLLESGIEKLYTGHCTGDKSVAILKKILKERLETFESGFVIDIE